MAAITRTDLVRLVWAGYGTLALIMLGALERAMPALLLWPVLWPLRWL